MKFQEIVEVSAALPRDRKRHVPQGSPIAHPDLCTASGHRTCGYNLTTCEYFLCLIYKNVKYFRLRRS